MSFSVSKIKDHLIGMGHGSTLNKVRNIEAMFERVISEFLLKCHPLDAIRTAALASFVYDDEYNYALPSDFGSLIDLYPEDNRLNWDRAFRNDAGLFDSEKAIRNKTISIESVEGVKTIRINWRSRRGKTLNTLNSLTANGTWSAVGSATGVAADTIFKVSGSASIKFTHVASGDGIQNTTMSSVDMTTESQIADVFVPVYFSVVPTSVTAIWGNNLTTKFWTAVAQTTQYDGTAFRVGWNIVKFSWSSATQTGTVTASAINSFKITLAGTSLGATRVDNIVFTIGRNFDVKYYSKFLVKNSSGTWITRTTSDDDLVMVDNDSLPLFLHECLIDMAQQMEGSDSAFDMGFAEKRLMQLYPAYKNLYPSLVVKTQRKYSSGRPARGRW